jgi:transposase
VRAYIQSSTKPIAALARELAVSETTIRRWRSRVDVVDRPTRPQRMATSLSPEEDAIVVGLRKSLGLTLDELLIVARKELGFRVSRSALHRCLQRHGLSGRNPIAESVWTRAQAIWDDERSGPAFEVRIECFRFEREASGGQSFSALIALEREMGLVELDWCQDTPSAEAVEQVLMRIGARRKRPFRMTLRLGPNLSAIIGTGT